MAGSTMEISTCRIGDGVTSRDGASMEKRGTREKQHPLPAVSLTQTENKEGFFRRYAAIYFFDIRALAR